MARLSSSGVVEMPGVSPYVPPAYDYGRISSLTQELASPNVRKLRSGLREAMLSTSNIENPAARSMMMRRSLEGYGQGLESAIGGARSGALSAYSQEYGPQAEAARLSWSEQAMRDRLQWQTEQQAQEGSRLSAPAHTTTYLSHDPLASVRNTDPSTSGYWNLGYGGQSQPSSSGVSSFNSTDPLGLLG